LTLGEVVNERGDLRAGNDRRQHLDEQRGAGNTTTGVQHRAGCPPDARLLPRSLRHQPLVRGLTDMRQDHAGSCQNRQAQKREYQMLPIVGVQKGFLCTGVSWRERPAKNQVKSALTLRPLCVRMIASARSGATLTTRTRPRPCEGSGMVSVTITSSIAESSIRSSASAANTPWVAQTNIRFAPRSFSILAASTSVPPVEIMSSTMTAVLPFTSPTISSVSVVSAEGCCLEMIASEPFARVRKSWARL